MEKNGGMVAVVQGLRDSNLTVTLLDGGKQYTLMPNDNAPQQGSAHVRCHPSVNCASQYRAGECSRSTVERTRENGIQATDGTYASTYKIMHCNLNPTSPPQTVTEFPPQRPEVLHGHGNFVVGGYGSGETARPAVKANSFKGGLAWPDKGSVCTSRASMQSDAFANSLRKYSNITSERSSEIVQRLISFTQAKNLSKLQNKCPSSPTRNSVDSASSKQTFILERLEQNPSKNSDMGKVIYRLEDNVTTKKNRLSQKSPVRERANKLLSEENDNYWNRPVFCNNNDVRCFRDTARKIKQGFKNLAAPPTSQLNRSSPSRIKDKYDCDIYQRRMCERESNKSVNMEIQAAAQMESKEILTLPRIVPMQRTIATPLSPIPSTTEGITEEGIKSRLSSFINLIQDCSCKSVQVKLPLEANIKITSSSIDLHKNKYGIKNNKRSRSEEEVYNIKKSKPDSILSLLRDFNDNPEVNEIFKNIKGIRTNRKRICQNCKHLFGDFDILRRSVSNHTYFREDFQYNSNEQQTNKHFIDMSKHCHVNGIDRVNKGKYNNRMQQPLENHLEFLSHIDTSNNIRKADVRDVSKLKDTSNNSRCIQYDCDIPSLVSKLVDRESSLTKGMYHTSRSDNGYSEDYRDEINKNNQIITMTPEEIRNLIDLDILAFTEKYRINITTEGLFDLTEELFDLFVMNLNNSTFPNQKHMTEKIKNVLQNRGLSEFQSIYLANILTEHWEEEFLTTNNFKLNSSNFKSETLFVFPNITQNSLLNKHDENNTYNDCDFSINEISQKDIDANVKIYMHQISNEINEWLSNLRIPETENEEIRQTIVNELTTDIVDRHKYLELNPSSEVSETSELEHLKYQLFKLIYKLGISDMILVDRSIELLQRIQSIAVPIFSIQERQERNLVAGKITTSSVGPGQSLQRLNVVEPSNFEASSSRHFSPGNNCCKKPTCKRNVKKKGDTESSSGRNISLPEPLRRYQATTNFRRISSPGQLTSANTKYSELRETPQSESNEAEVPFKQEQSSKNNRTALFSGGIKIRDEENDNKNHTIAENNPSDEGEINRSYNQYLKEWVEKIPLPTKSAEDKMVAEIARTDMYNGLLEAVSKLKSERDIFNDRFLFEDRLDDEIENFISKLPQSSELSAKKHILKVNLIEKTSNDLMKYSARSYKQQLVENLKANLPKPTTSEKENPEIIELYEELQILNLVEDFIICTRYQNQDPVIAEAYRKKLIKRTEAFVEELKKKHKKALKNIDTKLYLKDILDTLTNVPLPSNETIQNEADEILLAVEIDKWFSGLPLIQNNEFVEQLHRRRLRNNLAKQILNIEKKDTGNAASILDNSLKHEISQFLGRAPIQQGESLNINCMVEELMKRLKNRPISIGNESKKVAFDALDYEEFCKNMPLCSTYTGHPGENIETENRNIPSTKPSQAIDPSQQVHSGQYHIISKSPFDDLRTDQAYDRDLSMQGIPNYETIDNTNPKNFTVKDDEAQWYTLQASRQGYQQSNISLNNNLNQNRKEQTNKSIQAISPSKYSHSRHYHTITQPLRRDPRLDLNCCNENLADVGTHNGDRPRSVTLNGGYEPNRYFLQENKEKYLQSNKLESPNAILRFVPYPVNTSHHLNDQDRPNRIEQHNIKSRIPEQELIAPQHYLENENPNDYAVQQRHDVSHESRINSPRRINDIKTLIPSGSQDFRGINNNHIIQKRWPTHNSPPSVVNGAKHDSPRINQRNMRLDEVASPHRTAYQPTSPTEPSRHISNRSPEIQNIIEEQRCSGSPQMNRSDLFHRSTDRDGIRRIIERNRSMEANLDIYNPPEHLSGYHQPSVFIPPAYVPLRIGTKKDRMPDRDVDERFQDEEDSEAENDEDDEIRCKCVEKMWRNKRRYRYCPFDRYDGFPMCLTSPYFYPYFY